ncbi:MAG: AMP-binding protein, partial [Trueperaceae bacterium]|nr:AMP-binding protein [Trueperaceae bacterium]
PLSHMFEQTAGLFMPLSCGADITYLTSMQPAIILKTLRERRVVSMLLAPQILTLFMNGIEAEVEKKGMQKTWSSLQNLALQLPIWLRRLLFKEIHHRLGGSLKLIVVGGAALDPSQARKWTAMGIKVIQGYGTTETSPVITTHPLSKPAYGSAGLPLPGVAVKLAGDGEVLVKGDIVTPGYWEDPEQTAASFEEGWYKTGDIGFIDKNGFLHLSGRKKDLIVLPSGINVYPEDIEQVLNRHPGVIAAAVVGLKQGTQAHAALVLRDGSDMNEITRWANAQLSEHQHIQGATLWPDEDLPRTHTLKVKKHEIIKLIEANGSNVSETIKSPVVNKEPSVLGIIATLTQRPAADIHEHAKIGDDLGLDSLSRLDLLSTIESEFGVFVDEAFIGPSTTITELESFVLAGTKSKEEMQLRHWPLRLPICFVRRCLQSLVVFPIFRYYSRPTVIGLEHLKDITLPVLIVANHTSHFDSLAILNSLPPRFRHHTAVAAAKDYFFSRRNLAWFVSVVLNGFPFAREGALRPSLEYCAWLFDKGWSVLVYPEGTRSVTGKLGEFKSGTGLLATQMRVPVVPIRLEGLTAILPKGRTIPRRGHCIIHIGKPLFFNSQMSYEAVTMAVRTAIDQLGSFDNKGVQKL